LLLIKLILKKFNINQFSFYDILIKNLGVATIIAIAVTVLFIDFYHKRWNMPNRVIEWDVKAYYTYLPALFIYHDLSLEFVKKDYHKFQDRLFYIESPKGKSVLITTVGLSYAYFPFFIFAHLYALSTEYDADGYSTPYKFGLMMSSLVYLIIGLVFIWKILSKYFNQLIVSFTLIILYFGTNLFIYTTFYSAPESHIFSFSLISVFIYYAIKWHENTNIKLTILLGLILGWITLIRPTNIVVLLFLILYDVKTFPELRQRVIFFFIRYQKVLLMILCFTIIWIPQFIYWYYISGKIFYNSYGDAGGTFHFNNPQILKFLFSYKKGWLLYTPIMIFSFAGMVLLFIKIKRFFWPITLIILIIIYVLSSWWSWWFAGSFSSRSMVDFYGILSIPIALFISQPFKWKKLYGIAITTIIVLLIGFNLFQSKQYENGAIHWANMTKEAYWSTFLKLHPDEGFWELLKEYDRKEAMKGNYIEQSHTKFTYSKNNTLRQIEHYLRQNRDLLKEIDRKAHDRNISIDSMIKIDVNWIYYNKYLKEKRIDEIEANIKSNSELLKSIELKAREKGISLDSMIKLDVGWVYDKQYSKADRLYHIQNYIRSDPEQMENIKLKAKKKGISIDSAIKLDANWIYSKKYENQK